MKKNFNILLIDDDPLVLSFLGKVVEKHFPNVNIFISASAISAFRLLGIEEIHLILCDIKMEIIDGIEFTKKIKSQSDTTSIPVIFITSLDFQKEEDRIFEGLNSGGIDFIFKPIQERLLIAKLKNYIQLFETMQELKKQETKILQEQARYSVMGEMMDMILHQWNQPIAVIQAGSEKLKIAQQMGSLNENMMDRTLTNITNNTEFLKKTISDFRTFFSKKQKSSQFVQSIVENAYNLISSSILSIGVEYKIEYKCEKDKTINISTNIDQVLLSLYKNSIDAFKSNDIKNPYIHLEVSLDEKYFIVKVCDNAGGIPAEILPKIFDNSFTTKQNNGGTGVGLNIAKLVVEKQLGGSIKAFSENSGTCFIIQIPIND